MVEAGILAHHVQHCFFRAEVCMQKPPASVDVPHHANNPCESTGQELLILGGTHKMFRCHQMPQPDFNLSFPMSREC